MKDPYDWELSKSHVEIFACMMGNFFQDGEVDGNLPLSPPYGRMSMPSTEVLQRLSCLGTYKPTSKDQLFISCEYTVQWLMRQK
jgi:hypothetical protein